MTLLLTLDVGGSASRWSLRDEGGDLAKGELAGASGHLFVAAEEARFRALAAALARALPQRPDEVLAGITGLDATAPEACLARAILAEALGAPAAAIGVTNDADLAYRSAFAPGEGILVYSGTGSVALHIRADGTEVRAGGRGMLIDDGGSAFWIGQQALRRAWREREENPTAPLSPLANVLAEAMGGEFLGSPARLYLRRWAGCGRAAGARGGECCGYRRHLCRRRSGIGAAGQYPDPACRAEAGGAGRTRMVAAPGDGGSISEGGGGRGCSFRMIFVPDRVS